MRRKIELVGKIDASTKVFGVSNEAFSRLVKAEFDRQFNTLRANELIQARAATPVRHVKFPGCQPSFGPQYTVEYVIILGKLLSARSNSAIFGLPRSIG